MDASLAGGLFTAVGFVAGAVIAVRATASRGVPRDDAWNMVLIAGAAGLVAGRAAYAAGHPAAFASVAEILTPAGGLSLLAALYAGAVACGVYVWLRDLDVTAVLEGCAPALVAGIAIARAGELAAGRAFGPVAYELAGILTLACLLVVVMYLPTLRGVSLFGLFAVWYGAQRFLLDAAIAAETATWTTLGLSAGRWAGLGLVGAGLVVWIRTAWPSPEGRPGTVPLWLASIDQRSPDASNVLAVYASAKGPDRRDEAGEPLEPTEGFADVVAETFAAAIQPPGDDEDPAGLLEQIAGELLELDLEERALQESGDPDERDDQPDP